MSVVSEKITVYNITNRDVFNDNSRAAHQRVWRTGARTETL